MIHTPTVSLSQITSDRCAGEAENHRHTAADLPIDVKCLLKGVYIHVPFCFHKCHYCDFYSIVDQHGRQEAFVDRIIGELRALVGRLQLSEVETIYVGGGTPTLLEPPLWSRLLAELAGALPMDRVAEFTVEANPETVTPELLGILAAGGVTRLSIGAQTFHEHLLKTLERHHDPANVGRAVELARGAGIESVNLDLIFAIPGQSLSQWRRDLDTALKLQPNHMSCYSLMYEPNTALTRKLAQNRFCRVDEELEAAMYEWTIDRLNAEGFDHYEISAWARPGHRCRHNLLYWTNANWWPLGPSASGHVDGVRWRNIPRLGEYLESGRNDDSWPPIDQIEQLSHTDRIGEELMLRLRLVDGLDRATLQKLLAEDPAADRRTHAIQNAIQAGTLAWSADRLHLTRRGLLLADDVIAELI